MLNIYTTDEKILNEKLSTLISELTHIKHQIIEISQKCKFDKELLELNRKDNIETLLKKSESNVYSLREMLNKLNEQKATFYSLVDSISIIGDNLGSSSYSAKSQTITLKLMDKLSEEIRCIESFHKKTSLNLKQRLQKLQNLSNLWLCIDEKVSIIEMKLRQSNDMIFPDLIDRKEQTRLSENNIYLLTDSEIADLSVDLNALDACLSDFKSNMKDLTQGETQNQINTSSKLFNINQENSKLYKFYAINLAKLCKFKEIVEKNIQENRELEINSKIKAGNRLEISESLLNIVNTEEFECKTSTPRVDPVVKQTIIEDNPKMELEEKFKQVTTVNNTSIEIKIMAQKKRKIPKNKPTLPKLQKSKSKLIPEPIIEVSSNKSSESQNEEQELRDERHEIPTDEALKHEIIVEKSEQQEEEEFSKLENELKIVNKEKLDDEKITKTTNGLKFIEQNNRSERRRKNYPYCKYFFCGLIFAIIFVLALVFFCLPHALQSKCCDFKYEFLIFNQRAYGDGPLPF
jgi:hypothetical protein